MIKKTMFVNLRLLPVLFVLTGLLIMPQAGQNANGRVKPYYSGDAVSYNGRIFFVSANMGGAEIFELADGKISLINKLQSYEAKYTGGSDFIDAVFNIENERLYLYLTDGKYFYKYDFSQPDFPAQAGQKMDEFGDRLVSLSRCGGNIASLGSRGLKIWNPDLQVFYENEIFNSAAEKLQFDPSCNYIFNVSQDKIAIFNRSEARTISQFNAEITGNLNRKILFNNDKQSFYLADDQALKKFDYQGKVSQIFRHTSNQGYDVVASTDANFLYFSDGQGVVKMLKENLEPIDWVNTTELAGAGGWAMGLSLVKADDGEKIILFNGSNILVMDENLDLIDSHASTEPDNSLPQGTVGFTIDKNVSVIGEWLTINGQGFLPHEDIKISLADNDVYFLADDYGNFTARLETPPVKFDSYVLSATGLESHRSYGISYSIRNF